MLGCRSTGGVIRDTLYNESMIDRIAPLSARPVYRAVVIRMASVVMAIALLTALNSSGAVAQTLTNPNPKPSAPPPTATTKSRPTAHLKTCSMYGPGFMAVPGSDMCIKVGGGVTVEGTSHR